MLVCDSESDSFKFESTKIWVIACYAIEKKKWYFSFDESISQRDYLPYLPKGISFRVYESHADMCQMLSQESICFHNYFQHDKPLIKKFYPWFNPKEEHDSYILSQLFNPDRGLHGLDAWGERFGHPKPKHEEWDKFSPEMLHRVIEDVKINVKVWEALMKEKKEWEDQGGSWDEAIRIEYGIADLQGRQELHGLLLDQEKAYNLAEEIYTEIQKVDEQLLKQMPMRVIRYPETVYEREPFTKEGGYKSDVTKWFGMG